MNSFLYVFAIVSVAVAIPLNVFEDENGQEYLAVPLHRERRDFTWGANQAGYSVGQKGTIWTSDNDRHQFDGAYTASKAWRSHGLEPDSIGGKVGYTHNPTGSTAFIGADKTPGYGTDVAAGLKYNIAQGKNYNVDVTGQYGRHYGGPGGTGKPEAGVFLNAEAKI